MFQESLSYLSQLKCNIYITILCIPPSSFIYPCACCIAYLVIIAIPSGESRVVAVREDIHHVTSMLSNFYHITSSGTQHLKILILQKQHLFLLIKITWEFKSEHILPFERESMYVAISEPITKARLAKSFFVRDPVSKEAKRIIAAVLKQSPSAIRSFHVAPQPNVAFLFGNLDDVRFVYIVKTIRASSMGEEPCTAFSFIMKIN